MQLCLDDRESDLMCEKRETNLLVDQVAHVLLGLLEYQTSGSGPVGLGQQLHGHDIIVHRPIEIAHALHKHLRTLLVVVQKHGRLQIVLATRLIRALIQAARLESALYVGHAQVLGKYDRLVLARQVGHLFLVDLRARDLFGRDAIDQLGLAKQTLDILATAGRQ